MEVVYVYLGRIYLGDLHKSNDEYNFVPNSYLVINESIKKYLDILSTSKSIKNFINNRTESYNEEEVLKFLGLDKFDSWEVFKKLRGRSLSDKINIAFD